MEIFGQNISFPRFTAQNSRQSGLRNSTSRVAMRAMEYARDLSGLLRNAGLMFGGNRDVYQVYGYKNIITYWDCLAKYARQDIASRVVNLPADAIWTDPPTFDNGGPLDTLFEELNNKVNLWSALNRADKIAGMSSYCGVIVGLDDGAPLATPLSPTKHNITYLQPYSSENLVVQTYVTDTRDPRFGKPATYNLRVIKGPNANSIANRGGQQSIINTTVHWSRIIHIVENPLEDEVFGFPRMKQVFNLFDDMLKIGGGSAEVYWLNSRGGLHINVDKEMDFDPNSADELTDEVDDYTNNLRRVMRTRGVDVKPINMQMSDPRQPFTVTLSLIAAATGIPQRLLLGTEAGQLASEQDRANWANNVEMRRANFALPYVLLPLIRFLETIQQVDEGTAIKLTARWPDAFKQNPLEKSQTAAQQARSAANLVKAIGTPGKAAVPAGNGGFGQPAVPGTPSLVTIEEARKIIFKGDDSTDPSVIPEQPKAPASAQTSEPDNGANGNGTSKQVSQKAN